MNSNELGFSAAATQNDLAYEWITAGPQEVLTLLRSMDREDLEELLMLNIGMQASRMVR